MILTREAAESDNHTLDELQKKYPMDASLVLGVCSSPDYFTWSRQVKTAYQYDLIVGPLRRRKGIAEKLQKHIEQNAIQNDSDLLHFDIIQSNHYVTSLRHCRFGPSSEGYAG